MKKWVNVDLKGNDAKRFRNYCADMHLKTETSGAGEYTHFEVLCNEEEKENANNFLSTL